MVERPMRILLIEDDPDDALLLRAALQDAAPGAFRLHHVSHLSEALRLIADRAVDVVLMDLLLPGGGVVDGLDRAVAHAAGVPVVVLTGFGQDTWRAESFQAGAEDYLVKGQADGRLIMQALRSAIDRHGARTKQQEQSLIDELTGLYNRPGYLALGRHQLNVADRMRGSLAVIVLALRGAGGLDHLLGQRRANAVRAQAARALQATVRRADVLAKIGTDAFAVLASGMPGCNVDRFVARLAASLETMRARTPDAAAVGATIGMARYQPGAGESLDDLVARAERAAAAGGERPILVAGDDAGVPQATARPG